MTNNNNNTGKNIDSIKSHSCLTSMSSIADEHQKELLIQLGNNFSEKLLDNKSIILYLKFELDRTGNILTSNPPTFE